MYKDKIYPRTLSVLLAILDHQREGKPCTLRSIMHRLGMRHSNCVWGPVDRLRELGLVEPGQGSGVVAAIRPSCRFTREDEL